MKTALILAAAIALGVGLSLVMDLSTAWTLILCAFIVVAAIGVCHFDGRGYVIEHHVPNRQWARASAEIYYCVVCDGVIGGWHIPEGVRWCAVDCPGQPVHVIPTPQPSVEWERDLL